MSASGPATALTSGLGDITGKKSGRFVPDLHSPKLCAELFERNCHSGKSDGKRDGQHAHSKPHRNAPRLE